MGRAVQRAALLAAVVALCGACSSSSRAEHAAPSTTTTTTTTSPKGCVGPRRLRTGAHSQQVADVDGDGTPDTAYVVGEGSSIYVGIVMQHDSDEVPFDSASGANLRKALVVNADDRGPVELLLDDNRTAQLDVFVDCHIKPVLNPQGQHYTFDLGFAGEGTGVGCVDADGDGRRDLVGLNVVDPTSGAKVVHWTRTIIELDGATAHNGATDSGTYTSPADDAKIALLHTVTCGALTIAGAVGYS